MNMHNTMHDNFIHPVRYPNVTKWLIREDPSHACHVPHH
jgi:hypothetical protein